MNEYQFTKVTRGYKYKEIFNKIIEYALKSHGLQEMKSKKGFMF